MPLRHHEAEELKTAFDMVLINKEKVIESYNSYQKSRELFFNTLNRLTEEPRDAKGK